ncbi:MAG TPA: endo-1,4-beta-xylanase [Opitutaceae bacterium]
MRVCLLFFSFTAACLLASASAAQQQIEFNGALRRAAGSAWLIGGAVNVSDLDTPRVPEFVLSQFNCLTVETELMPFKLGAQRDAFAFEPADRVVAWGEQHHLPIFGHMLLWDYRVPSWLFQDDKGKPLPREQGLANLRYYIRKVLDHYRGKMLAWNVVNEAISDAPGEFLRDTAARRCIGEDYIARAFQDAEEADSHVELYYNDYNVVVPEKRAKVLRLVQALRAEGRRVDAIGLQGHWTLDFPAAQWIDDTIQAFTNEGVKVRITELDVDVLPRTVNGANMQTVEHGPDPYTKGLPPDMQQRLANRYEEIFDHLLAHPAVLSITFWGLHDGRSWLNDFPVLGRTNHALLFDRQLRPKPAEIAVLRAFAHARQQREEAMKAHRAEPVAP